MRERMLRAVLYSFFILLIGSLFFTQIFKYPYYYRLARNNVIRIIPIDGPRGNMFDRNGLAMVTSRLSFDVAVIYQELKNQEQLVTLLSEVLGISRNDIMRSLEAASLKSYAPFTIAEDIDKEKALVLDEMSYDVGGLIIETRSKRYYAYGNIGCHVFGYLSEIGEEELGRLKDYGYKIKDLVGRDGLEKYYDKYLTGADGGIQIEVDSRGRQVRTLGLKEPSSGKDLYLTLDASLQSLSDNLLGERSGAIIVMDPRTGEILALASHPAFDPNVFVKGNASEARMSLLRDRIGRPLLNRAISALYAPGSVFKICVSSGALESKRITEMTRFSCSGSYNLGRKKFDCWKDAGHGSQEITDAIMNSCNVFFYQTGRAMGVDNIETFAKLFGFGKPTGIDLPDEAKGIVPGRLWKRMHRKDSWYEGDTVNYAIGQGYLLVTPIQVLEMMSVVANGGNIVKPYLVKKIDADEISQTTRRNLGLKNEVIQKVREGLFKVVNAENGTGGRARLEDVLVAGKTGTAQNPQGRTHAWFTGFAPYNTPKVCLVVFLEHGGHGGLEPAEMAKKIFEEAKNKGYL